MLLLQNTFETLVGLPGRQVEKTDTLDLFLSSAREPKIEGLRVCVCIHMYIPVYLCPVRAEIFNRTSRPKTELSGSG